MNQYEDYLESLDITVPTLKERIATILKVASEICTEPIEQLFVSEYKNPENTRTYEGLWFFSKSHCLEAHDFTSNYRIDIVSIAKIFRLDTSFRDYDFNKATSESRLTVRFSLAGLITGELKATAENCDYLRDIMRKYFIHNVVL